MSVLLPDRALEHCRHAAPRGAISPTLCTGCGWPAHVVTVAKATVFRREYWRHNPRRRRQAASEVTLG